MEWLGGGDVRVAPSRSRHSMKSRAPLSEMRSAASVSLNGLRKLLAAGRDKSQQHSTAKAKNNQILPTNPTSQLNAGLAAVAWKRDYLPNIYVGIGVKRGYHCSVGRPF